VNKIGSNFFHHFTIWYVNELSVLRKNFFPLRVTEPWNRQPREAVESPSLEIFKTHLDKVLFLQFWAP